VINKVVKLYVRRGRRLALWTKAGVGTEFWAENWGRTSENELRYALRPTKSLGFHTLFFRRWLPRKGIILEASCGEALWVSRLSLNGWKCIGLDKAGETLSRSKRIRPDLTLVKGDVLSLPFPDASLAGYLSLGVMEHFEAGLGPPLKECYRVLRKEGVALISVPYENYFRKRLPTVSEDYAINNGMKFYQYYFTLEDIRNELLATGFNVLKNFHGYGASSVLARQYAGLGVCIRKLGRYSALLDFLPGLTRIASHMIFAVGIKET